MKFFRFHLILLAFLSLGALSLNAAQLASAKVTEVLGTVTKYTADGGNSPVQTGDILKEGDSISASALSQAKLVFSNGSLLTIEENTSISISELSQDSFSGSQSYEQLEADPSKSQVLLELNYGILNGHVKKLQKGSKFDIATPLGTAAIRGTKWSVKLFYNAERGEFLLIVKNKDGELDILSRYLGEFEYGAGNIGDKGYDSALSNDTNEPVPQKHTVVIRLHRTDPYFGALFNLMKNYIPTNPRPGFIPLPPLQITPEDGGVIVVSPENQGNNGNNR